MCLCVYVGPRIYTEMQVIEENEFMFWEEVSPAGSHAPATAAAASGPVVELRCVLAGAEGACRSGGKSQHCHAGRRVCVCVSVCLFVCAFTL